MSTDEVKVFWWLQYAPGLKLQIFKGTHFSARTPDRGHNMLKKFEIKGNQKVWEATALIAFLWKSHILVIFGEIFVAFLKL